MPPQIISVDAELKCPHCDKTPDYEGTPAQDFTIPGRTGRASRSESECGWCYGIFTVETNEGGNTVTVEWEIES